MALALLASVLNAPKLLSRLSLIVFLEEDVSTEKLCSHDAGHGNGSAILHGLNSSPNSSLYGS